MLFLSFTTTSYMRKERTCDAREMENLLESKRSHSKRLSFTLNVTYRKSTCLQEEPRSNIQLQLRKPPPGVRAACAHSGTESAARERHAGIRGSKAKELGSRTMKQSNSQQQIQPLQIAGPVHFSPVFSDSVGLQK